MSLCCLFYCCCLVFGLESHVLMFNLYDDNLLFRYLMTDKCENFTFFIVVTAAVAVTVVVVVVVFPVHYLFFSPYASVKLALRAVFFLSFLSMSIELTLHTHCFSIRFVGQVNQCICYVLFLSLVRVHSIAAATLFMSHIRNAYIKRSNFLHQCFKYTQTHKYTCVCRWLFSLSTINLDTLFICTHELNLTVGFFIIYSFVSFYFIL